MEQGPDRLSAFRVEFADAGPPLDRVVFLGWGLLLVAGAVLFAAAFAALGSFGTRATVGWAAGAALAGVGALGTAVLGHRAGLRRRRFRAAYAAVVGAAAGLGTALALGISALHVAGPELRTVVSGVHLPTDYALQDEALGGSRRCSPECMQVIATWTTNGGADQRTRGLVVAQALRDEGFHRDQGSDFSLRRGDLRAFVQPLADGSVQVTVGEQIVPSA